MESRRIKTVRKYHKDMIFTNYFQFKVNIFLKNKVVFHLKLLLNWVQHLLNWILKFSVKGIFKDCKKMGFKDLGHAKSQNFYFNPTALLVVLKASCVPVCIVIQTWQWSCCIFLWDLQFYIFICKSNYSKSVTVRPL